MGDPITNEVLAERMSTLHDDLRDIKADLAKLVSREVYDANRDADKARIAALEKRADQAEAREATMLRWVVGAVALPILLVLWQLWMSTHGGHP